jgi:hypothetical protein
MKVVKLNRRFRQYKKHGHVIAVRCDSWLREGVPLEKICDTKLGAQGYVPDNDWHAYFGKANGYGRRPFWITFRRESDLTLVLLSAQLTNNA